jgi:hypothetical protein
MIRRSDAGSDNREPGALVENVRIRVLNCSPSGCLLESDKRMALGTVGTLHLSLAGHTFSEVVEVVRCQVADRTADLYHVATRFLATSAPRPGSLRHAMRRDCSELAGWLTADDTQ